MSFCSLLPTNMFFTHRTRRHDSKRFLPKTEEEVFQILGLPWIDPTMRNVDA
jgi:DNA polymerase mu